MTARIVLMLSFTAEMTYWVKPFWHKEELDVITGATPLDAVTGATSVAGADEIPGLWDMFIGFRGGSLGETSNLALLIGFAFLVFTRVIRIVTPVAFIGTVAIGAFIAGADVGLHVFGGGLFLGAVFMATDYSTTPVSMKGKFVFGVGCGLITLVIRFFSDMPEGVSFAILIMNILTFYIDKVTFPKPFGAVKGGHKK